MSSTTRATTATTTSQVALKGLEHMFFLIGFLWNRVCPWDIEIHVINERKTNLFTTEAAFTWFLYRHSCIVITMGSSHNEEQFGRFLSGSALLKKKERRKKETFPLWIRWELKWRYTDNQCGDPPSPPTPNPTFLRLSLMIGNPPE